MKNKKSFRKAALPILCALLASVLSLTSVTYAWFTSGTQATVDTINVGVESAGGLQISLGTNNEFKWSSSVNPNITGKILAPVSTTGVRNADKLDFFTASYDDTRDKIYNVTSLNTNAVGESEAFISFDLYFRNAETEAKTINLAGTTVKSPSGSSHTAARLAFIEQGVLSTLSANQTPNSVDKSLEGNDAKIYEPNATEHTVAGKEDYKANKDAETGKFEYRAIAGASAQDTYYNRYTGEGFTQIAQRNEDGTGTYVFDAAAETAEKFVAWNIKYDYTKVTLDAAADVHNSVDGVVYTADDDTTPTEFTAVSKEDTLENGTQYYVKSLATLYNKVADAANNVLTDAAVTTVDEAGMEIVLAKQTITKVTIYIWLEGQDADCENSIASYSFNVDLKFDIVQPAQQG